MQRFRTVTVPELTDALESPRPPSVIDVRTPAAYAAGHIPGAIHVPVHDLAGRRSDLPRSVTHRIVVVGDPGKRLTAAASFLVLMGYGDVSILEAPVTEWPADLDTGAFEPPHRGPVLRTLPPTGDSPSPDADSPG